MLLERCAEALNLSIDDLMKKIVEKTVGGTHNKILIDEVAKANICRYISTGLLPCYVEDYCRSILEPFSMGKVEASGLVDIAR